MAVIQLGSACACQRIRKDKCSVGEWVRDNPQRGVLMVALVTLNLCHHIRHPSKRQVGETEAVHCGHMKKKARIHGHRECNISACHDQFVGARLIGHQMHYKTCQSPVRLWPPHRSAVAPPIAPDPPAPPGAAAAAYSGGATGTTRLPPRSQPDS